MAPPIADVLRKRMGDALQGLEGWLKGPLRIVADPSVPVGGWSIKGVPLRGQPPAPPVPGPTGAERP